MVYRLWAMVIPPSWDSSGVMAIQDPYRRNAHAKFLKMGEIAHVIITIVWTWFKPLHIHPSAEGFSKNRIFFCRISYMLLITHNFQVSQWVQCLFLLAWWLSTENGWALWTLCWSQASQRVSHFRRCFWHSSPHHPTFCRRVWLPNLAGMSKECRYWVSKGRPCPTHDVASYICICV